VNLRNLRNLCSAGWILAFDSQAPRIPTPEGRTSELSEITDIGDVTTSPDGKLMFLLEGREGRVLIFDRGGRQVGAFGRLGEGPGELARASRLGWRADTLWVMSPPDRLHFFRHDGTLVRTVMVPPGSIGATASGGLIIRDREVTLNPRTPPRDQAVRNTFAISHREGSSTRRVAGLYESVRPIQVAIRVDGRPGTGFQNQPFRDDPLYVPDRDGHHLIVVLRGASPDPPHTFQVIQLALTGDTVFSRTYSYPPQPIDRKLVQDRVTEIERVIREASRQASRSITWDRAEFERGIYRPPHVPAVESAVIGRDGTIWLKRDAASGGRNARYQVLSRNGDPVAIVELPATERLVEVHADRVYTIATDEDDVPFARWYRIAPR
jgi:hypothetical protein